MRTLAMVICLLLPMVAHGNERLAQRLNKLTLVASNINPKGEHYVHTELRWKGLIIKTATRIIKLKYIERTRFFIGGLGKKVKFISTTNGNCLFIWFHTGKCLFMGKFGESFVTADERAKRECLGLNSK